MEEIYIPKNVEQCFEEINKIWDEDTKALIKQDSEKEFLSNTHNRIGPWMRNNWELWSTSQLSGYFNSIGIKDADDMSSVILCSYYRNIFGRNIELKPQILEKQLFKKAQATI